MKIFCITGHKKVRMVYSPLHAGFICPLCKEKCNLSTDKNFRKLPTEVFKKIIEELK